MTVNRHLKFRFLLCAIAVFTSLVVAYFVTHEPHRGIYPGKNGQAINIGTPRWKGNNRLPFKERKFDTDEGRASNNTYIITQTFGGQMTRAIRNMMLQQCWAVNLEQTSLVVEPFTTHSNLYHSPTL